jgi:hypothetical protein
VTGRDALAEGLTPRAAATLRVVSGAMGGGVIVLSALAVSAHLRSAGAAPLPQDVRVINMMTVMTMAWSLAAIVAGETLWKRRLASVENPAGADAAVTAAFVIRLACREGSALLGGVVCLLAAMKGVLRAYPAYWVDLVPAALFFGFLAARWPSLEGLRRQVREP